MPHIRALALALALAVPIAADAGTLCGTVTERQSSTPVAHAGIFLRLPDGTYTGIHGASDETGHFCIANVPAGTYDLEVRVDDEQVAYLRGVVVTASSTDVDIGAALTARLAPPFPNPAHAATRLRWALPSPSPVRLAVYDARGRLVRGWSNDRLPAGEHSLVWDLRDARGHPAPPGIYFVRLDAVGARQVRTFALTR